MFVRSYLLRPLRRWLVPFVLMLLVVGLSFPAAGARPPAEEHCVISVVGEAPDGELLTELVGCYDSFASAMSVASGGAMSLDAEAAGDVVFTDPEAGMLASTFTLGIHYDGFNGTGSSITVVGSSCSGGYWNTPWWFDNRISSSYNGCYHLTHYDYPYMSGVAYHTYGAGQIDNLGWFSNRTESVRYTSW